MPSVRTRCRSATRSTSMSRPAGSLSASANVRESNGSSSKKAEMTSSCVSLMGSLSRQAAGLPHGDGSLCRDWSRQGLAQLQSSAMDARSDGVRCQSACLTDFGIAEASYLPHEEDVTVDVWQCGEGLVDGQTDVLRRRPRAHVRPRQWLGPASTVTLVIERDVSGDAE